MCPPTFFSIAYEINPWMNLQNPVDSQRAKEQWQQLRDTYLRLGWQVDEMDPDPRLPDMVFTANGGLVIDDRAMVANFRHPDRQGETALFTQYFKQQNFQVACPRYNFEGEGDGLLWGDYLLLGYPWRSDKAAHAEVGDYFQKEVLSLQLTSAYFYHLDTCLTPLDNRVLALYPPAFTKESLELLNKRADKVIVAERKDALAYGLNACSYRDDIVIPQEAVGLIEAYKKTGRRVWPIPMTEFKKSGGGVKCLTLEIH